MLQNFITSLEAVLPLFLMILLGMLLRRTGMLEEKSRQSMNQLSFRVFLPIYLFCTLYAIEDISAVFDPKLLIFGVAGLVTAFTLLMLAIPLVERENRRRSVMIQAMFRSNFALFGLPLAESLCGGQIGPTSLMLGLTVPIFNTLAVICLETFRGGKPSGRKMLRGIATNPLIIGCLLGIAFYCLKTCAGFTLPAFLHSTTRATVDGTVKSFHAGALVKLGNIATPLSLISLGSQFALGSVRGFRFQLTLTVVVRLVVLPVIMVTLGVLLGLRNEFLVPVLIMFGAPTAVSSYPMAQQMGGDSDLAAAAVVFTSGFASLTIFLFIFALKSLGLIL